MLVFLFLRKKNRQAPAWMAYLLAVALVFLTLINIEQAHVIAAQRAEVQVFERDSFQYFHLLGRMHVERGKAKRERAAAR